MIGSIANRLTDSEQKLTTSGLEGRSINIFLVILPGANYSEEALRDGSSALACAQHVHSTKRVSRSSDHSFALRLRGQSDLHH